MSVRKIKNGIEDVGKLGLIEPGVGTATRKIGAGFVPTFVEPTGPSNFFIGLVWPTGLVAAFCIPCLGDGMVVGSVAIDGTASGGSVKGGKDVTGFIANNYLPPGFGDSIFPQARTVETGSFVDLASFGDTNGAGGVAIRHAPAGAV